MLGTAGVLAVNSSLQDQSNRNCNDTIDQGPLTADTVDEEGDEDQVLKPALARPLHLTLGIDGKA